jgi:hypothetical protein
VRFLKANKDKSTNFYCFSPPVMIATFVIEIFLAFYVVYRYKMNPAIRLIAIALGALALFQLSEFFVCTGPDGVAWSRIGYVAITALPPLGLHILNKITGHKNNYVNKVAYVSMGFLMVYFLLSPTAFSGYQCTGNYVIFQLTASVTSLYMLYYYGWLMAAFIIGLKRLKFAKLTEQQKSSTKLLLIGYLVFLVPTAIVNTIHPQTTSGIPSIMCGFAVFFALILGFKIAPGVSEVQRHIKIPFINKDI